MLPTFDFGNILRKEEHTCSECGEYDSDTELDDGLCPECAEETRLERIEEKRLALIVKEVQGDRKEVFGGAVKRISLSYLENRLGITE